jgi:hypothetical protein
MVYLDQSISLIDTTRNIALQMRNQIDNGINGSPSNTFKVAEVKYAKTKM